MEKKKLGWLDDVMPDQEWIDLIYDANVWFVEVITVIVVSTLLGLNVYYVLAQPAGLAGLFGRLMATTCVNTGYCDFQSLMGALGLALVILSSFTAYFILRLKAAEDENWNDEPEICPGYRGRQREIFEKIMGLGTVESLSGFASFSGIPYSTLHGWCEKFEEDGFVEITRNGKGSAMIIKAKS